MTSQKVYEENLIYISAKSSEKPQNAKNHQKGDPSGLKKRFTQTDYLKKTQGETFGETEDFLQTVAQCRK